MRKRKRWNEFPALQKDIGASRGAGSWKGKRTRAAVNEWSDLVAFVPFLFVMGHAMKLRRAMMRESQGRNHAR